MPKRLRRFLYLSDRDTRGRSVSVVERPNSGGRVRVKWTDNVGTDNYVPLRGVVVRDKAGTLKPDVVEKLRGLVAAGVRARTENRDVERAIWARMQELNLMGDEVRAPLEIVPLAPAKPSMAGDTVAAGQPTAPGVTLGAAFDRYFSIDKGEFAADSRQRRDELGMMRDLFLVVPADTPIAHIGTATFRQIWKAFARLHFGGTMRDVKVGRPPSLRSPSASAQGVGADADRRGSRQVKWGGLRHAVRTIDMLRKLLASAVDAGELSTAPAMPRQWKKRLRNDWAAIADEHGSALPVAIPGDRNYEPDEGVDIFATLGDADPRLELIIECFVLWRLGQALRLNWSDLRLQLGDHGAILCRGRGQKWGLLLWLTPHQRRVVDRALATFLAPYERARLAGTIADYPLIPGARLNSRKPTLHMGRLTESRLRDLFNDAERAAGVEHVEGRGWYGLRRLALNELEDLTHDDHRIRGLLTGGEGDVEESAADGLRNALSGHGARSTRERYQRHDRPEVWRVAIRVMEKLRERLGQKRPPTKPAN
jgi:hypothetical protein